MTMDTLKQYVLEADEKSAERLLRQHELYEHASQQLLLQAGLKANLSVLELGCGPGAMTPWLCQQLTKGGQLLAVDLSPEYIRKAQSKTEAYENCECIVADVHHIDELDRKFDIIYCRMILHHLHDPDAVMQKMMNVLNPNGRLVCEEPPIMEHVISYPHSPAMEKFKALAIKTYAANKSQFKIAYTMANVMESAGLKLLIQQIFQPLLDLPARKLHLMALRDMAPKMIELGFSNESELIKLSTDLENELATATAVSLYKMFQVVGVKQT
jgi:ubiquinone/menaquinone biosynthesis C-methylase UbiE